MKDLRPAVEGPHPLAAARPRRDERLFSPRTNLDALGWYAALAARGRQGIFMTFAFGMHDIFKDVFRTARAPFRLALLERKTRPLPGRSGKGSRSGQSRCSATCRRTPSP